MDRYELRRLDYSLTEDHKDLQAAYRQLFDTHCSIETVWAAEESGYDKSLWERLCAMGASSMAISEDAGGDGATLVDLTLVAEELGRALAPVPWIDHVVATRLWERLGGVDPEAVAGTRIVALDPRLEVSTGRRLIGSGAVADRIIVRDGDDVILLGHDARPAKVDNLARLPMAWVDPAAADQRVVLGSGPQAVTEYVRALDEWRVLTAAALAGLVEQTMTIAAEFAKSRYTLGVPISTLSTSTIYYNVDLFEKLGIPVPKTYADLKAAVPKLKEAGVIPLLHQGSNTVMWPMWFFETFSQASGDAIAKTQTNLEGTTKFTDAPDVEAFKLIKQWVDDGVLSKDSLSVDQDGMRAAFAGQHMGGGMREDFIAGPAVHQCRRDIAHGAGRQKDCGLLAEQVRHTLAQR